MPKFKYTAKTAKGENIVETTDALDKESLIQKLQGQGYFILKIEAVSS